MAVTSGVKVIIDRTAKLAEAIALLASSRVMVGIPAVEALRRPQPGEPSSINNAALLYIHEHGAPEANIPARPSVGPGIAGVQRDIRAGLGKAGELALRGDVAAVDRQLHRVGMLARDAIKAKIRSNIPPPLKPATIAKRRRRSKGSKYRRKATAAGDVIALIDTAQMINAVNYVIRKIGARRR